MGWFQKKTTAPEAVSLPEPAAAPTPSTESVESSRAACLEHLSEIFADGFSKGVVSKVYIENFKTLNEVFGYDYCEELLSQILHYLREKTGQPVYRYIGVEFIIILEDYTQGRAMDLAEEILEQFDHVWKIHDTDCLCSIQVGLCSYPGHPQTVEQLLKYLDQAVARATDLGPNQAVMYDTALFNQYQRRQTIAQYLKTAIKNQEIEVRYRPTYNIRRNKFSRAEYYMRIFIKGVGLIGASEFLPTAEDSGQIREVEYFALDQVGACIADLIANDKDFDSIALPISPILFLQEDFLSEVKRILDVYQIPPGKLALEIKESALTSAYLNVNVMLQELSDLGVEVILNEFGSGYSGIASILELPVDTLKLERLFVWQLETNPRAEHIIGGLVRIARHLGLDIIAEGVETEHQISVLNKYECIYQQGFYYAPTVTKDVLVDVIGTSLGDSIQILNREKEKMRR